VWFDDWVIKAGDDIYLAIERGLEAARVQVLCLSPAALGSEWVTLERSTVLFRDPANAGRRFVPLLLADCTLPDTLRRYKYLDFRQETPDAFDELLAACRAEAEAAPLAAQRGPEKKPAKPKPKKPPEQAMPLAVLERTLTGHTQWVNSVAVSPDGTWAASGSDDRTIKIWDMETGECRTTLEGHTDRVLSVSITPDGKRILSGSLDNSIRVWDAESGRELMKLEGHTNGPWTVAALRDNARALSGGWDNTLKLWDLASGKCLRTIECGTEDADNVFSSAVNPAGTQVLSGHRDGRIGLWNLETGKCLVTLRGHTGCVHSVKITPDGRIEVWNLEAGTCVGTLEGHVKTVTSVVILPYSTFIASVGMFDQTVRLWDWKSGALLKVIEYGMAEHVAPFSIASSPDSLRLIVGTALDHTIYVYRLTGVRASWQDRRHNKCAEIDLRLSPHRRPRLSVH
jgi:WD40 repeat protein